MIGSESRISAEGRLAGARILVVEDDYFIADEISRLLSRNGAQVLGPVPEPSKADMILSQSAVDCAILDIDLHGRPVFPLVHALKLRKVPWLYVSGYSDAMVPEAFRGGAHIEKPLHDDALVAAVAGLRLWEAK